MTTTTVKAFVGANIWPGAHRPVINDSLLLIEGTRILWLGHSGQREIPAGAEIFDVTGKWIIPGLVEGHCHVSGFASPAYHPGLGKYAAAPVMMEELARFGVTTIRDTGGPDLESMQLLQGHDQPWPRFFGSGPNLDGQPGGPWKGMWKTTDPQEVIEFVQREHAAGADFIKLYAWMGAEMMQIAVDEAHRLGLVVAAHVGWEVTVEEAVRMGVDALEHVRIGRELVSGELLAELDALPRRHHDELASSRPWRYVEADGPEASRVLALMVEHGVYMTPTLVIHERILHGTEGQVSDGEPAELGEAFAEHSDGAGAARDYTEEDLEFGRLEFDRICRFVGLAFKAGVPIVAGSDSPSASIRPGRVLHEEMELLVSCGLTPEEALVAATMTPAMLLGQSHRQGRIMNGYLADFTILEKNPLEDIKNSLSVLATWRDGSPIYEVAL